MVDLSVSLYPHFVIDFQLVCVWSAPDAGFERTANPTNSRETGLSG